MAGKFPVAVFTACWSYLEFSDDVFIGEVEVREVIELTEIVLSPHFVLHPHVRVVSSLLQHKQAFDFEFEGSFLQHKQGLWGCGWGGKAMQTCYLVK